MAASGGSSVLTPVNQGGGLLPLAEEHQPRVVPFVLSRVPDIASSVLKALMEAEQRAPELGFAPWLPGLNPGIARWRVTRVWPTARAGTR